MSHVPHLENSEDARENPASSGFSPLFGVKLKRKVISGAVLVVLLASCTSESTSPSILEEAVIADDEARLKQEYVFAFVSSPWEIMTVDREKGPSYLGLVQEDGTLDTVQAGDLIGGDVSWGSTGVYFSDVSQDYLLTEEGLTASPSEKDVNKQMAGREVPSGEYVGLYNVGFEGNGGYTSQVVVSSGEQSTSYDAQGAYFYNSVCEDGLYSVTSDAGLHRDEYDGDQEITNTEALVKIFPTADDAESVIAWKDSGSSITLGLSFPCQDGVVSYLAMTEEENRSTWVTVVNWDTSTGVVTETPVTDESGKTLDLDDMRRAVANAGSIRNGSFEWIDKNGALRATNLETGVTTKRFDTGWNERSRIDAIKPILTPDAIVVFSHNGEGDAAVEVFDRASGDRIQTIEIPDVVQNLNQSEHSVWSMAIKPGWV